MAAAQFVAKSHRFLMRSDGDDEDSAGEDNNRLSAAHAQSPPDGPVMHAHPRGHGHSALDSPAAQMFVPVAFGPHGAVPIAMPIQRQRRCACARMEITARYRCSYFQLFRLHVAEDPNRGGGALGSVRLELQSNLLSTSHFAGRPLSARHFARGPMSSERCNLCDTIRCSCTSQERTWQPQRREQLDQAQRQRQRNDQRSIG